jgi:putative FmdB family regulatory protein
MPIYQMRCRECLNDFEELRKIEEMDAEIACPSCGVTQTPLRLVALPNKGFILKPYWNTNIDKHPIFIESKQHLKRELKKRRLDSPCLY